ncbi:hypothetical protein IVB16_32105 [Bradyrhizobium sp. 183]|uniref:hypothetical protein n=1 Tax=Bradyrhizobium sp. 184 TaxID=2782653 RepID=UPI001FFE8942|nr:hypothetical protein [Bradyrhizobium sp. 184]UPJ79341.1 hypothetical protein IVB17_32105 [Bradyrhizobium sp. 184]UPJ87135.1 hypothetical protein IVB16_32105 [Bradyrhizobium sp. 183]
MFSVDVDLRENAAAIVLLVPQQLSGSDKAAPDRRSSVERLCRKTWVCATFDSNPIKSGFGDMVIVY